VEVLMGGQDSRGQVAHRRGQVVLHLRRHLHHLRRSRRQCHHRHRPTRRTRVWRSPPEPQRLLKHAPQAVPLIPQLQLLQLLLPAIPSAEQGQNPHRLLASLHQPYWPQAFLRTLQRCPGRSIRTDVDLPLPAPQGAASVPKVPQQTQQRSHSCVRALL